MILKKGRRKKIKISLSEGANFPRSVGNGSLSPRWSLSCQVNERAKLNWDKKRLVFVRFIIAGNSHWCNTHTTTSPLITANRSPRGKKQEANKLILLFVSYSGDLNEDTGGYIISKIFQVSFTLDKIHIQQYISKSPDRTYLILFYDFLRLLLLLVSSFSSFNFVQFAACSIACMKLLNLVQFKYAFRLSLSLSSALPPRRSPGRTFSPACALRARIAANTERIEKIFSS